MKRVLKFLVRLYPPDWRKRYGVEYLALLDEGTPRFGDVFDVVWQALKMQVTSWSFAKITLLCALCGALVAAAISFTLPAQYTSQTVILVTTGDTVADTHDRTVAPEADAPLRNLTEIALSDATLASIVQKLALYPGKRARLSREDVINQMRKGIDIKSLTKSPGQSSFALQFSYPDPQIAQQVDRQLVSTFITSQVRMAMSQPSTTSAGRETLRVEQDSTLPLGPSFPKRGVFGAGGLFAGLLSGLILATFIRQRRETLAAR